MSANDERRKHTRVELFPMWEEKDLHRVWLFHEEDDSGFYGLMMNMGEQGCCMLLHNDSELPPHFVLHILDHNRGLISEIETDVKVCWSKPYFAGFKAVGVSCHSNSEEAANALHQLEDRLDAGEIEFVRCHVLPAEDVETAG